MTTAGFIWVIYVLGLMHVRLTTFRFLNAKKRHDPYVQPYVGIFLQALGDLM
jgi:hypothetical protein